MDMFKNEWKSLIHNKILLISSIAILFIPIIYGAFFLKAIWDPYGQTSNLPVAVVNNDQSVVYQKKVLDVGDALVKNLKNNNDLDWNFVNADKAEKGLDNGKYYMVITIPKNFSQDASTLLDENPKKMNLTYKTNPSQNYIGSVITRQGANHVKNDVATSVTKEYARLIFSKITETGSGMTQAATGSKELDHGATQLANGNKTITGNLQKLASSTLTFKDGLDSATIGSDQLSHGANQINVAVSTVIGGVNQLTTGSSDLQSGLQTYTNGVSKLNQGSQVALDGSTKLYNGIDTMNSQFPELESKVATLNAGQQKLNAGIQELAKGIELIHSNLAKSQGTDSTELETNLEQLRLGAENVKTALSKLSTSIDQNNINQISTQIENLNSALEALKTKNENDFNTAIDTGVAQAISTLESENIDVSDDKSQAIINAVKEGESGAITEVYKGQNEMILTAQNELHNFLDDIAQLQPLTQTMQEKIKNLEQLADGTIALADKSSDLPQLVAGINEINAKVNVGSTQQPSLKVASQQLAEGTGQLNEKIPVLKSGVSELAKGSSTLTTGIDQINDGLNSLDHNSGQLVNGVTSLTTGLNQLSSNLPQLQMGTLALASGTNQLGLGLRKLADGSIQLNEGSVKLAEGSILLGGGIGTLKDGTLALSQKLSDGAKQISDIKTNKQTYDMFANPTKLSEEKLSSVPNYGHALAPYVLSLGLYVGAMMFNLIFPIRRPSMTPTSGISWWLSKFSIGFVTAILQALIMDAIILALGLGVDHMTGFITISILTSLTYMFLIMFMAISFGNPGRFIAMIILVLQLGGSGGTFPMPLTSGFSNFIHPFLPMSYSIYGFRQAISSGLGHSVYIHSAWILIGIFIFFNLLLMGTMHILKNKEFKVDNHNLIEENI